MQSHLYCGYVIQLIIISQTRQPHYKLQNCQIDNYQRQQQRCLKGLSAEEMTTKSTDSVTRALQECQACNADDALQTEPAGGGQFLQVTHTYDVPISIESTVFQTKFTCATIVAISSQRRQNLMTTQEGRFASCMRHRTNVYVYFNTLASIKCCHMGHLHLFQSRTFFRPIDQ